MGYLPKLEDISSNQESVTAFSGYNHNYHINNYEFYDMKNMSGRNYPALSPRVARGLSYEIGDTLGLSSAGDYLYWARKEKSYPNPNDTDNYTEYGALYRNELVSSSWKLVTDKLSTAPKTFVNMGAYLLIWPDKVAYNTATDTLIELEHTSTIDGGITLQLSKVDATDYQDYTTSDTAPSDPTDGQLWLNTSVTPHVLMQYSVLYLSWQSIPTTYIKLSKAGIGSGFKTDDAVTISGATNSAINGDFILYGVEDDFIIITGIMDTATTEDATVTITRKVPDMDFLCECNNRIWGCSSSQSEIYACKLGDPTNWYYYTDQSTASYSATVGSQGSFTGCCSHLGYVLFFKENEIITLRGTKPANFQLDFAKCRGVEKGSEKSLVVVNETLYYKSAYDICAYGASQPSSVSDALGGIHYKNAVSGAIGSLYYINMEDDKGNPTMFVYDEKHGVWYKEDSVRATAFATLGRELYFINASDNNRICMVNGTEWPCTDDTQEQSAREKCVEWYAETDDIGSYTANNKYISKLQFRLEVPEGSLVKIELQYDSNGLWIEKYRINATRKRSFTVPIIPRRCDHMKVRISGIGDCKVYSFTKTIETGSEV